jgi:hypothetical protein
MFKDDLDLEETHHARAVVDTKKYFTPQEWSSTSDMNKQHLISQMRNYFVLQKIGKK